MKTIRIDSKLYFHELFEPLFKHLQGCQWIVSPDAFAFPLEWDDLCGYDSEKDIYTKGPAADFDQDFRYLSERISESAHYSYGYFSEVDIFPKYSKVIREDWNNLYAFQQLKERPEEWSKKVYSVGKEHVASTVYCYFANIDMAFWQFSSNNEVLLSELEKHLEINNIQMSYIDFCL